MANILYHSVEPENNAVSYSEFSTADFILTGLTRKMVANSLRLEGQIEVDKAGTAKSNTVIAAGEGQWAVDNMIGLHSVVESVTTEV